MNASLMAMFPTFGCLSAHLLYLVLFENYLSFLKKDKDNSEKGDLPLGTNMVDFALLRSRHRYRPRLGNRFGATCQLTDKLVKLATDELDRPP
jgi:hypothetical protein